MFDTKVWDDLIANPLWYAHPDIWGVIDSLFLNPPSELGPEERRLKDRVLAYFMNRLKHERVALGGRKEFFNDDDRWTEQDGWKLPIDTVVIHHTATDSFTDYEELNALGLLRLYCPVYKNSKAFQPGGELQPISSGHFWAGRQTFAGYSRILYVKGMVTGLSVKLLDDRYVGFHAGNYALNCRSVGIALVGDLTDEIPSTGAIAALNNIIAEYPNVHTIIGHCDVQRSDGKTTVCPGNRWNEWKHLLIPSARA